MSATRLLLATVSVAVLAATLLMHLYALAGGAPVLPAALGAALLVAEFVVLVAFVVSAARHFVRVKPSAARLLAMFPGWVLPLVLVVSLYSFGSLLLQVIGGAGETPVVEGGRYLLLRDGQPAREIDEFEYRAIKAADARAETAYSLVFVLVPCLWFLTRREPASS